MPTSRITRLINTLLKIYPWLVFFCNCIDPFTKQTISVIQSTKQMALLKAEFVKESNGPVKSYFRPFFLLESIPKILHYCIYEYRRLAAGLLQIFQFKRKMVFIILAHFLNYHE